MCQPFCHASAAARLDKLRRRRHTAAMMQPEVTVIGAGLAGCEAAWRLAQNGVHVRLVEMKPTRRTAAQTSDFFAELVCSNSLRSRNIQNAVGLLKEEMRRLGSLIVHTALAHAVPAGDALAVNRETFGHAITQALRTHPRIHVSTEEALTLPEDPKHPVIVATGPLTGSDLAASIASVTSAERLYFYDAIAPIISGDSIDMSVAFAASRYDKGEGADYLNCPLDAAQYAAFIEALKSGACMPLHAFEEPKYFQGCLPVEVIAARGDDALRFGPMKPVGLTDPRTGRWPHAVVQLRREDKNGQAYNLVGFQTKLKYPDQKRIFRMIPGLQDAEFLRLGAIHRNTYLDSPALLDARMRLVARPHIRFAGQITGVEGYVESAAHGLLVAHLLLGDLGRVAPTTPPPACAMGALLEHVKGTHRIPGRPHEPQNINWSMFPPPPAGMRKNMVKDHRVERAQGAMDAWLVDEQVPAAVVVRDAVMA